MITLTSDSANLGDNLMLTPLLNATPCRLRLYDEEWMRFTAPIFNDLCEIEWFTDRTQILLAPAAAIPRPWSKRWLVAHGFHDTPAIPSIKLTYAELEDGRKVADHISRSFGGRPLCVIKAHPGRTTDRIVPAALIERIVAANPETQFVMCNLGDNHPKKELRSPPIKGVFELTNLPVRAQASVYAAIGRYVGADTGDYHLMLAVGGKADVICPAHSLTYDWWLTHYGVDCWMDQPRRVEYHMFDSPLGSAITDLKLS